MQILTAILTCLILSLLTIGCSQSSPSSNEESSNINGKPKEASSIEHANKESEEILSSDPLVYTAEINRLEQMAAKNPVDEASRIALAKAYVNRAHVLKGKGQFSEALKDYREALKYNPDNETAQQGATAMMQELGIDPKDPVEEK
jgi:tetratricopeptide (TPR) repeat protein